MFKKYLCWLVALPMTLLFAGCTIENDIPYPFVESVITAFEVEGQCNESGTGAGSALINYDAHTVQVYVEESVDLNRLSIRRFEVSNNATIAAPQACLHPDKFPTQGFKQTSDAEATRVNFSAPVQFTLTTYQDYVWTVSVTQVERSEVEVFTRCSSATVSGEVKNGKVPTVEYCEHGTQNWTTLPAAQISVNADKYTAEITGLTPGTSYDFRSSNGAKATFTTEPALQLPNSSFDDWSSEVSATGKTLWLPKAEGADTFWDTGNRGATTVGASNSTGVTEDGRTFANLQSKYIVVKFAAGNIFAGDYLATDGTNGILNFGRPFTSFPTKMKFDYKYQTSPVNRVGKWDDAYSRYIKREVFDNLKGNNDSCAVYIALLDDYVDDADREANTYENVPYPWVIRTRPSNLHLFDPESPRVIAYGQLTQGDNVTEWTTHEITLNYRYTNRKPKYIVVVASSSKYGDYFTGGDKSLLQIDNLELIY